MCHGVGDGEAGKRVKIQASQLTKGKLLWTERKPCEEADETQLVYSENHTENVWCGLHVLNCIAGQPVCIGPGSWNMGFRDTSWGRTSVDYGEMS